MKAALGKRPETAGRRLDVVLCEEGELPWQFRVPTELPDLARALCERLDPEERKELIRLLTDPD